MIQTPTASSHLPNPPDSVITPAAASDFTRPCESIAHGGDLFALPALLASGPLRHASKNSAKKPRTTSPTPSYPKPTASSNSPPAANTPKHNAAVAHLCAELNVTETRYPGTDLRMIFKSVSS